MFISETPKNFIAGWPDDRMARSDPILPDPITAKPNSFDGISGKDQLVEGRIGNILSISARACNTRAQGIEILKRSPTATPVVDVLTYWVDVACWYLEGIEPVEVTARGTGTVFREAGFSTKTGLPNSNACITAS